MSVMKHPFGRERILLITGVGLIVLSLIIWFLFWDTRPSKKLLRITGGNLRGIRHQFAELLKDEVKSLGIVLEIEGTQGSEEALDKVNDGDLDFALVQGGLHQVRLNVRQVAALHIEPLHLLVKKEIQEEISNQLLSLRGKTINCSQKNSGTHTLSLEVLKFIGIDSNDEFQETNYSSSELESMKNRDDLPDAIFKVSSLPSPLARYLVTEQNYDLVPIPFGEAFSQQAHKLITTHNLQLGAEGLDHYYIHDVNIPAYTYQVNPSVPAAPLKTLGSRLLLVANRTVPSKNVEIMVEAIFTGKFTQISKPALNHSLLYLPPEFPLHEGTQRYLRRIKPLQTSELMELPEKMVSFGAPILGGMYFLIAWLRRKWQRVKGEHFIQYVQQVSMIERRAMKLEMKASINLRKLMEMQKELSKLKLEALDKFATGEIEGEELLSGFLTQINDARSYITRLILHERDNLEGKASTENRPIEELWNEMMD
jgi:TRAP-type uncharacterized transport system substrate-binding protein